MQIDVIIQARMGSTRLAGKVLKELHGKIVLQRVIEQSKRIKNVSNIVVATSDQDQDLRIVNFCKELGVVCIQGDEEDILSRYIKAGEILKSDVVIRATGDNPFLQPEIVDLLILEYMNSKNDYTFSVGFPLGTSCEVFSFESLKKVNHLTQNPIHHEHIGTYFLDKSSKFIIGCVKAEADCHNPGLRLTIDTQEDFETGENFLKQLPNHFSLRDILRLYKEQPELCVNKEIEQVYPTLDVKKVFSGENPLEQKSGHSSRI